MFGFLKKRVSAEQLAKTLTTHAIGNDACYAMVSMMRYHTVADEVAIYECAFLRASYLRSILSEHCDGSILKSMNDVIESEVVRSFSGKEKSMGKEAIDYYQHKPMRDISKSRLAHYRELNDSLAMTSPMFCARLGARNVMMNIEVQAMLNDLLGADLRKSLKAIKPVFLS